MPAKLTKRHTLNFIKYHIRFTVAALRADPNAADLEGVTSEWMPALQSVLDAEDVYYQTGADNTAARGVANYYLDVTCKRYGLELYMEEDGDRDSTRYRRYFSQAPSQFIRQPLADQVTEVKGWLTTENDALLDKYRSDLETWSSAAATALENDAALAGIRADYWTAREALVDNLTKWRDQLYITLVQRAIERGLPRDWPDLFFKAIYTSKDSDVDAEPPETEAVE